MSGLNVFFKVVSLVSLSLYSGQAIAAQLSTSTEVQENIKILTETKICPQCNLSGADLNRLDLSGANLEGAILSRATMALSDLSGANLQNADLRETIFNGADLGHADLRGADLTGSSLVGAYMKGAMLDGEIVVTRPYSDHEEISEVQESVYVEDTANSKTPKSPDDITIASRRDYEETPPALPEEPQVDIIETSVQEQESVQVAEKPGTVVTSETTSSPISIPQQSAEAPAAKIAAPIPEVHIEEVLVQEPEQAPAEVVVELAPPVEETMAAPVETAMTPDAPVVEAQPEPVAPVVEVQPEPTVPENEVLAVKQAGADAAVSVSTHEETATDLEATEEKVIETQTAVPEDAAEQESMVDSAVGMVTGLFSSSDGEGPQTEQMRNIAILLERNQCYGCDLSGADLSGEDLEDADLESANLQGANLSGADLENANLKGADLSGANLRGADLSEADLYTAILKGADLTDAKLEKTQFDDVDLSQVKGYQTQAIMLME